MLEDVGHQVRFASDGREALQKIACVHFDMVVTDIVMPEMNGIELIGELRRRYPEIRIIAMSGGSERFRNYDGLTTARRLGAGACLDKPFMAEQLLDAVYQLSPDDACANVAV
jgi:CheY-like chemotaxis protein